MFADTDAIRTLGSANSGQAADLATIAGTLASLPVGAGAVLGPIGDRFLAALFAAARQESQLIARLSDRAAAAAATAHASARVYHDADQHAGASIFRV